MWNNQKQQKIVMICHLHGICRYEKKILEISSVALLCSKRVTRINMELNARLIFLPTDFDQISQLYDNLSINVYSGR